MMVYKYFHWSKPENREKITIIANENKAAGRSNARRASRSILFG